MRRGRKKCAKEEPMARWEGFTEEQRMIIMHLGDLHLGKTLGEFSLLDDQSYMLDRILEVIDQRKVQVLLVAGDIYDRSVPPEDAVALFDRFLKELADRKVEAFFISGNHDSEERINYGSRLFDYCGIHMAGKYEGKLAKYTLEDEFGPVNIYLLPFVKASLVRHYHTEAEIHNYEDAVRTVIAAADIRTNERNIIVSHQFVIGSGSVSELETACAKNPGKLPEEVSNLLDGSESVAVSSVGLVEEIGYRVYDAFDYAALGHIHSSRFVGREEVRYSGSLLKYSLRETGSEKTVPILNMKEKGCVETELLHIAPLHDLRHIKGKMADLLQSASLGNPQDYIYATLTDEEPVPDVMRIFQQTYPKTVKIDIENSHTKQVTEEDLTPAETNLSFTELITAFYASIYGSEITEEELRMVKEAAREAGVDNEAD